MKNLLLISLVFALSAVASAQITNPVTTTIVACTTHTDITNTGNTGNNVVLSCGNLQNLLSSNARLTFVIAMEACTAASTPFAGCAGINTGTCTMRIGLNTTNSGTTSTFTTGAITAGVGQTITGQITNRNATNAQISTGFRSGSGSIVTYSGATSAVDTTGATFLNILLQNSASGDICGLRDAVVTLWTN